MTISMAFWLTTVSVGAVIAVVIRLMVLDVQSKEHEQ